MIHLPPAFHTVVCSLHPAHAMRGLPQLRPSIMQTMARAAQWADRERGPDRKMKLLLLDPTPEAVEDYLRGKKLVAIDIETPRDDNSQINRVGVSVEVGTAACFEYEARFFPVLRALLSDPTITKVGHNFCGFDNKAFSLNGMPAVWPVMDTIQAEALLRPPLDRKSVV